MPMSANNIVQTGPKTHDGGLKLGFVRVVYHVVIDGVVKTVPTIPASSEPTIAITSCFHVVDSFIATV